MSSCGLAFGAIVHASAGIAIESIDLVPNLQQLRAVPHGDAELGQDRFDVERLRSASSCDTSRTCKIRSASITSSSVARNAATNIVGRSEMNPTVSERMTRNPFGRSTARKVGSSVANSMSAESTLLWLKRLNRVDLPALV